MGIGECAFDSCTNLTSIIIPSSVIKIDNYAFNQCNNLTSVIILSTTPPTLSSTNAFMGIPSNVVFTVPKGTLSAYQTATNWSDYADKMVEASN